MGKFWGEQRTLTDKDCCKIAANGGVIGHLQGGYNSALRTEYKMPSGWACKRIAKEGVGNRGTYVLQGLTPTNRALVREGKAMKLAEERDISLAQARVCVSQGWGMEPWVIEAAKAVCHHPLLWADVAILATARYVTDLIRCETLSGLSDSRQRAVFAVVQGWWAAEAIFPPAPPVDACWKQGDGLRGEVVRLIPIPLITL